jgi:uncharacterized protein (DUF1330 family)
MSEGNIEQFYFRPTHRRTFLKKVCCFEQTRHSEMRQIPYGLRRTIGNQGRNAMKNIYYTVGLSMLAGAVLGAGAIQGLHAQAKPVGYAVVEIDVKDQDGFQKEFAPLATKALSAGAGYKALARGGNTVSLYGDPPKNRIVINSFESLDAAVAAYNSPDYKAAKAIGDKYATFNIYAVEGAAQ